MKRIKIVYRKNLKMSEGKIAAQSVHAALGLAKMFVDLDANMSVIVLGVSDKKFKEFGENICYVVRDAGYTEVKPGTETCLAFVENEPERT